jgi:hypothetical protein
MKPRWVLAMLMLVSAGCGEYAGPGGSRCRQGLCVKIEVMEPVRWEESNMVRIIVTSDRDIPELGISLMYINKEIVVEEPEIEEPGKVVWKGETRVDWKVGVKAHQPIVLIRKIRFPPQEGYIDLRAMAITPQGQHVTNSVSIYLTREGGVVNPTPAIFSGTPPLVPTVPPELLLTPFPTATPWPTPIPTPTVPLVRTPTPTEAAPPFISPLPAPTPAVYP